MQKLCSYCLETKDESEFYRDSSKSSGLMSRCKFCETNVLPGQRVDPRDKLRARVIVDPSTRCWIWQGRLNLGNGYSNRYRDVFELLKRPLLPGEQVHHVCVNGACVNPEHLVALEPEIHKEIHDLKREDAWFSRQLTNAGFRIEDGQLVPECA